MFAAGDVSSKGLDIRLPNHVFNALKMHSKKEEKYNNKIHDRKERATHVCILLTQFILLCVFKFLVKKSRVCSVLL